MTKQMNLIMPMMFGLFALQFASGLSIYFIVSNLVGAVQSYLMNRRWKKQPLLPAAEPAKISKGSKPVALLEPPAKSKKSTPLPKPVVDDDDQAAVAPVPSAKSKKSTPSPKSDSGNGNKPK